MTRSDRKIQELLRDYVLANFSVDAKTGRRRRVMVMLFRGEDAVRKVRGVIGNLSPNRRGGETIRDTYSDLILDDKGRVRYFEPAVLAAPTTRKPRRNLKIWARYSDADGGILENVIAYAPHGPAGTHAGAHQAGQFQIRHRPPRQRH